MNERPKFYFTNRYPIERPNIIEFDNWEDAVAFMKLKCGDTNFYVTCECDRIYVHLDNIQSAEWGAAQYRWISEEEWEEIYDHRNIDDTTRAVLTLWQNDKLPNPEDMYGEGRYEATDLDKPF